MDSTAIGWIDDLFHLFGREPPPNFTLYVALSIILLPVPIVFFFLHSSRPRQGFIPPYRERVLILGASSGVGEQLALQYALRGCRSLVLVARRAEELEKVKVKCHEMRKKGEEWEQSQEAPGWEKVGETVTTIQADCTKAEDLLKIRQTVRKELGGLDTLHIVFGASALRSLLGVADVDPLGAVSKKSSVPSPHATLEGITATIEASRKILDVNVAATAGALATFIPILQLSSVKPSIILMSSVGALVPPPTRSLYGSSKAAQLSLFQAAAIESDAQVDYVNKQQSSSTATSSSSSSSSSKRNKINFFALCPATIRTSFRQSAVDGPADATTIDLSWASTSANASSSSSASSSSGGGDLLEPETVAYQAIRASDRMYRGLKAIPAKYRFVRWAYLVSPGFIDNLAKKKYGYGY